MTRRVLETEQKALEINLDDPIYGAFAEIGAGQEVARYFFQVGAAAGTIAKSMSAYDKTVSDEIYGPEQVGKGRYVCESRLYKMLDHEYKLMEQRLRVVRPDQTFFAFADTVAAINYSKTIKGDGWLGLRFQLHPNKAPNDLIVHVRMLDQDNRLQQQAVGIVGVNMVYAAYRYFSDPETLVTSLLDNLKGRVAIDMVRLTGPDFEQVDNRLVALWLVKNGLSEVAIFGPNGDTKHAGEFLYRKSILIARGSYRPPTLVQEDMIRNAYQQFLKEAEITSENAFFLTEITLANLQSGEGLINEQDFLDRATLLCAMGQTVVISNCVQHKRLIAYFSEYKVPRIGLVLGARKLEIILRQTCEQQPENLLTAFGELFPRSVRFYVYPAWKQDRGTVIRAKDVHVPEAMAGLYNYLLENNHIVDIQAYDPSVLGIYHKTVLEAIQNGDKSWEKSVSPSVAALINQNHLFQKQ